MQKTSKFGDFRRENCHTQQDNIRMNFVLSLYFFWSFYYPLRSKCIYIRIDKIKSTKREIAIIDQWSTHSNFQNILQNGVSTGSPCSPRRRASLMAELVGPVPRLELESKFVEPAAPPRKSIPGFMAAPKFASTPKPDGIRRSMVDGSLPTVGVYAWPNFFPGHV